MSLDDKEESRDDGYPVEFFLWTMGTTAWRDTNGDANREINDPDDPHTYTVVDVARRELEFDSEPGEGGTEVSVPLDHPVAVLFQNYTPPAPVGLVIRRLHRSDGPTPEIGVVFIGSVSSCDFKDSTAVLRCSPVSGLWKRPVPTIVYQSRCNWALFSPGCTKVAADYATNVTLTSVAGVVLAGDDFASQDDGWWTDGWVERANGERRFITSHVGDTITVSVPFASDLAVAEVLIANPGCDGTEATCRSPKFDNILNFMGMETIPDTNPFGGNSIV